MFYVWLDLETTGLDKSVSDIIEVASIITDEKFIPIDKFHSVVNPGPNAVYESVAFGFHKKSGLIGQVPKGRKLSEVEIDLLNFIKKYEPRKNRAYLAGNSIHFDRAFMEKGMPSIIDHLTHRHLDVSALGVTMRALFGKKAEYKAPRPHRALEDLERSISELKFYIESFITDKSV